MSPEARGRSAHDLIVIGAGPAGASAALAAAAHGLDVVLLDEEAAAGGQVFRAPAAHLTNARDDPDRVAGDRLRQRIAESKVKFRPGRRVWSVSERFRVDTAGAAGHEIFSAPRLVAATGAHERVVPFPGWTLPGVVGLAAVTILLKSQGVAPGRRVLVAGCGPLLVAVAAKLATHGGEVVAMVDLASRGDWLQALPALTGAPSLLRRGLGWSLTIASQRIPVFFNHGIRRAEGDRNVSTVVIGPVDRGGAPRAGPERRFTVDALAVGHGLVPGGEIPRLYGATESYDRLRGGLVPTLDPHGRTEVPGLYAVGDGAGLRGAPSAIAAGELAGLAAAAEAGALSAAAHAKLAAQPSQELAAWRRFADAMAHLMALRPAQVATIAPDTVVCRCEDVIRRDIDEAVAAGARDLNQMKHFTRCGMGPCQGRMCGEVAAELMAHKRGVSRVEIGCFTGRPPLRPVPLESLLGDFAYADIPIPRPAPL